MGFTLSPHVELSTLHGENTMSWISESEEIFTLEGITKKQRVRWGLAHIRGQAKTWLNSSGMHL
jgi:hypothetical protein